MAPFLVLDLALHSFLIFKYLEHSRWVPFFLSSDRSGPFLSPYCPILLLEQALLMLPHGVCIGPFLCQSPSCSRLAWLPLGFTDVEMFSQFSCVLIAQVRWLCFDVWRWPLTYVGCPPSFLMGCRLSCEPLILNAYDSLPRKEVGKERWDSGT